MDLNKPIYLGIETSTPVCSVSLFHEGKVIDSIDYEVEKSHSAQLTLLIRDIMERNGLDFPSLSGVCFADGPGSYTGLRIGASVAKGLSYAHQLELLTISGLEACAYRSQKSENRSGLHLACSDARRKDIYAVLVDPGGNLLKKAALWTIDLDMPPLMASSEAQNVYLSGQGSPKLLEHYSHPRLLNTSIGHSAENLAFVPIELFEKPDVLFYEPYYMQTPNITKSKKQLG